MALHYPRIGPNDVPTYQMSAIPFVTSSGANAIPGSGSSTPLRIPFRSVTRFFIVNNLGAGPIRIGFTDSGVRGIGSPASGTGITPLANDHNNYFVLSGASSTGRLEIRCKELFLLGDTSVTSNYSLIAGLTPIADRMFPTLSASNGFEGVG
jgi:hypothetical protein